MKKAGTPLTNYGIRLDSGDLAYISKKARKMLDEAGFTTAVISASNDLDEDFVYALTAILFSHAGEFDTYLSSKLSVSPETALEGLTIPLHPGALEYYNDNGYDTSHLK